MLVLKFTTPLSGAVDRNLTFSDYGRRLQEAVIKIKRRGCFPEVEYTIKGKRYSEGEADAVYEFVRDLVDQEWIDEAVAKATADDEAEFAAWVKNNLTIINSTCKGKFHAWRAEQESCLKHHETDTMALAYEQIAQMYSAAI